MDNSSLVISPVSRPVIQAVERLKEALSLLQETPEGLTVTGRLEPQSFQVAEAFEIKVGPSRIEITAKDSNGLAYGIEEVAASVRIGEGPLLARIQPGRRGPYCCIRSLTAYAHNADLEAETFYSEAYWDDYFGLLSRARYNTFAFTFGHQTAYFSPPFPFFVEVPGYENVKVEGLTHAYRQRNLEALRMIARKAEEWGIVFVLGIWQQHAHEFGKSMVSGLEYADLFDYCPKALGEMLRACEGIRGLQFRMNMESGIAEEDQAPFFEKIVDVVSHCGRDIRLDLRAKGLRAETIERAAALAGRFIVSTKFWCEHLGLPYFATEVIRDDREIPVRYRRYGYWDLLENGRPYDILFRLWSLGSQRVLLWGDPAYAARFARSAVLENGPVATDQSAPGEFLGYEVMAPLSHKGFGNRRGGPWRVLARAEDEFYQWEFERYWAFYLCFGLAGYEGESRLAVYEAEFLRRFGAAGPPLREALGAASGVIPLVTAAHAPSASVFGYWPEMDTGGLSDMYAVVPTGDPGQFASISEFVATPHSSKISPLEVAERLEWLSARTLAALSEAECQATTLGPVELRGAAVDLRVLAALGRYHAARMRSACDYLVFQKSGDEAAIAAASVAMDAAVDAWREIVRQTDGFFYDQMVFNRPPSQVGHWKDELPALEEEAERLRGIYGMWKEFQAGATLGLPDKPEWIEREMMHEEEAGKFRRWIGHSKPSEPLPDEAYEGTARRYAVQTPRSVVSIAAVARNRGLGMVAKAAPRTAATVEADIPYSHSCGQPLLVRCQVAGNKAPVQLRLHYRFLNQVEPWQSLEMRTVESGVFEAELPASLFTPRWDVMLASEVIEEGCAPRWLPDLWERQPYWIIKVVASKG